MECDEAWSFVKNKKNKQWLWLAKDRVSGKLLEFMLEIEVKKVRKPYGILFLVFIGNVLFVTLIFGMLITKYFQLKDIIL